MKEVFLHWEAAPPPAATKGTVDLVHISPCCTSPGLHYWPLHTYMCSYRHIHTAPVIRDTFQLQGGRGCARACLRACVCVFDDKSEAEKFSSASQAQMLVCKHDVGKLFVYKEAQ